jgi:hypothetical protein
MYNAHFARRLSATEDQFLTRDMGSRDLDEAVDHWIMDASTPEQLDALAFQLLCNGRRCRTSGITSAAAAWKKASKAVATLAAEARARIAANPTRETHPGFWSNRSIGRPGCLDSDLFLPLVARVDLGRPTVFTTSYAPELIDGTVYAIRSAQQHGRTYAYFTPVDGSQGMFVPTHLARGLQNMGRLVALPLSAVPALKAAA